MWPWTIGAIEALFYLSCVPIHVALAVDGLDAGAGVSAFGGARARRRALRDLAGPPRRGGPGTLWRTARRVRFDRLELTGTVSLGDAALTAVACGALNGLAGGLRLRAARARVRVRPDFSNDFRLQLRGMLTARAGKIIWAALNQGRKPHGKASD